ncbi:hypothetical protein ACFLUO_09550 [Chloroflexota bacterium]
MSKYTHLELDEDIKTISGYYTPLSETRLEYNNREVLYVVGEAVIESSCCGSGNWAYVLVSGYIVNWQNEKNENGLPVSEVERISDTKAQADIKKMINEAEHISRIEFL